jgi:phage terminase Nu1 subunit (DNA packaging protein)
MSRAPVAYKQRESDRNSDGTVGVPGEAPSDDLGSVPGGKLSLADATAQEKAWKARLAELQYREKSGVLVDARQVELKTVEVFTRCRTKLLGVPAKLKASCPELTRAQLLAIDAAIRQSCEELAAATDETQGAA